MMNISNRFLSAVVKRQYPLRMSTAFVTGGDPGSGAGKGGGAGGTIREAGGTFGKKEAAQEEQYFRKLQADQLKKLKDHVEDQIESHKELIKKHEEEIKKAKEQLKNLEDSLK